MATRDCEEDLVSTWAAPQAAGTPDGRHRAAPGAAVIRLPAAQVEQTNRPPPPGPAAHDALVGRGNMLR
jgi:hypothetical protein